MDDLAQRHHRDGTTEPGLVTEQHVLTFVCEAQSSKPLDAAHRAPLTALQNT